MTLTINYKAFHPAAVSPGEAVSGTTSQDAAVAHVNYTVAGGSGGTITAGDLRLRNISFCDLAEDSNGSFNENAITTGDDNGTYNVTVAGQPL